MMKSLFLLTILPTLFLSCGKKLEDSNLIDAGSFVLTPGADALDAERNQLNLLNAIESDDTLLVRNALDPISDLDFTFSNGETPLTLAIKSTKAEIVLVLINKGNIVDRENKYLETPLNLIIESRRLDQTEKRDIIKRLLSLGVDIDKKGINGVTPIQVAIRSREEVLAVLIVKQGANISESYNGVQLIELAKMRKLDRLVEILNEISALPISNKDSIKSAINKSKRNLLEYLVNVNKDSAQIINENDLLIEALKIKKMEERVNILNYLLRIKGVNPDGKGIHTTPLIYAASQFQSTHRNSLTYLLRAGANIYHRDNRGISSLDYAAKYLNLENVKYLYGRIVTLARETFNQQNSQASSEIMSACNKTPSKDVAEDMIWNGVQKRYNLLRVMRCPFY